MIIRLSLVVVVRLCVPCDLFLFVEQKIRIRVCGWSRLAFRGCTQHCRFLEYWCGRVAGFLRSQAVLDRDITHEKKLWKTAWPIHIKYVVKANASSIDPSRFMRARRTWIQIWYDNRGLSSSAASPEKNKKQKKKRSIRRLICLPHPKKKSEGI